MINLKKKKRKKKKKKHKVGGGNEPANLRPLTSPPLQRRPATFTPTPKRPLPPLQERPATSRVPPAPAATQKQRRSGERRIERRGDGAARGKGGKPKEKKKKKHWDHATNFTHLKRSKNESITLQCFFCRFQTIISSKHFTSLDSSHKLHPQNLRWFLPLFASIGNIQKKELNQNNHSKGLESHF